MRDEPFLPVDCTSLRPFIKAGILGTSDVHVAEVISKSAGDRTHELLLAIALSVRAVRMGDVCVMLEGVARTALPEVIRDREQVALEWPEPSVWMESLSKSEIVFIPGVTPRIPIRPLVLEDGRCYLDRYWNYECMVAQQLDQRASDTGGLFDEDEAFDHLFSATVAFAPDDLLQATAVRHALTRRLTVIAGGPGTGKTWTIARLLGVLGQLAHEQGREFRPALCAPTATAAKRMTQAIKDDTPDEVANAEPDSDLHGGAALEATTIHRLLGANRTGSFRFHRDHLLSNDLVIVDEVSMVSLPLIARLLDALAPDTSLVLVGDPNQLSSVEAGAVIGEIVGVRESAPLNDPIANTIIELERQHRFGAASRIDALANAVRSGSADEAIALVQDADPGEIEWINGSNEASVKDLEARFARQAEQVIEAARHGDPEEALRQLRDRKIICATRYGPRGVYHWSARIEQLAGKIFSGLGGEGQWYIGRPIIVNRNDYLNSLLNGDVGVVVDLGRPVAAFGDSNDFRKVPLARLREIDTWWAMTIHKSQGSQFEEIVVSLPEAPSPVLTRELLYTAITRAKSRVTLVASEEAIRLAVTTRAERASGLGDRLRTHRF